MKRILCGLMIFCACMAFLSGCVVPAEEEGGGLRVCASFETVADFCGKIGGDEIHLSTMVPSGAEAHDWEPSPADIVRLQQADLLVINGAGFERWVDAALASLDKPELVVVDISAGLRLLAGAHDHRSGQEEDAGDHQEESYDLDPHTWLSPVNAKAQLQTICEAFAKADPANADAYNRNLADWQAEMDALDAEYREALSGLNKDIVVTHEAYGYICDAYGLAQHGIEGISADSDPDPKRMADVIRLVQEKQIRVIFFDPSHGDKVAKVVADATGAETRPLYPLEGLTARQQADGEDYCSVMRLNLEALKEALS